jgi:hypothetical protein
LRTRTLRLSGRQGSVDLQEPALVIEGNLLRFGLFGIEWLFRRALSEWTTVTVPYSRIIAVRRSRAWLVRVLMALVAVLGWALIAFSFALAPNLDALTVVSGVILTVLCGYIIFRLRPKITVVFRTKAERKIRISFLMRKRATRLTFLDALAAHRAAAARHVISVPVTV